MTLPRYMAILNYQKKHPPLHIMVAGFIGRKPTPQAMEPMPETPEFEE